MRRILAGAAALFLVGCDPELLGAVAGFKMNQGTSDSSSGTGSRHMESRCTTTVRGAITEEHCLEDSDTTYERTRTSK